MYKYVRTILKNVIETQSSCFDKKLEVDLETIHIVYNFIKSQQKEIESLKCCGNCGRTFNMLQVDGINCNIICKRSELVSDRRTDDYWTNISNKE